MATKVKPSRLNVTGTPQTGNVPVYVDEDTFSWGAGGGGGTGDVVGPASSTDGDIVLFDGATGKLIKDGNKKLADLVQTSGNQTIAGAKTFANVTRIQNGDATGALILGADLRASTVTADRRKMARMGMPSYANAAPVTIISGDSQNARVDLVDFGGNPLAEGTSAPDFIRFVVAKTHGDTTTTGKINMLEVSNFEGTDLNQQNHIKGISLNATTRLSNDAIPAAGDNSNEVPSTSWVNAAISSGIGGNVYNSTVNFKQNDVTKGSITMNQSTGSDVNLETVVPVTQSGYNALPASKTSDGNLYLIYG